MRAPTVAVAGARCQVLSGEKLLAASGGAAALCRALERAVLTRGLEIHFTVKVRVEPRSIFSAEVTLPDGRKLPPVQMAEMDRPITKDTLDRFGFAIADHVAGGAR